MTRKMKEKKRKKNAMVTEYLREQYIVQCNQYLKTMEHLSKT